MDEIWEKAVETALDGQTDVASVRTLTLDGAVKCVHGRLPPPSLFEKFTILQHLSIANIGVSSLEQFPRLQNLQKLILSDNRIAGGLEFLVEAGLGSLRDLDLSNNRIQEINDLRPLAELRLVSLDLYECPVTRVKDYRSRVFGLIKSLKYLDKMDAEENERPESDDEEEEDDEEDDEDDPGSGEIDGEDRPFRVDNGHSAGNEGIVDVDEDEESDADEEETETSRGGANGVTRGVLHHQTNGFLVEGVDEEEDEYEDGDGDGEEEDNDSVEEVDEEEGDDEDVVVVHEIEDSDDEEDGVEDDDEEDDDDDEEEDEEEVDNDEGGFGEPESTGRLTSTEGEIDGHEQGEDGGDEDDIGETGEEEQGIEEEGDFEDEEDAEDEEEDHGEGYLVQPVGQVEVDGEGRDMEPVNEDQDADLDEEVEDEEDDQDGEVQEMPPSTSQKRKRDDDVDDNVDGDDDEDDDVVEYSKSSKHR